MCQSGATYLEDNVSEWSNISVEDNVSEWSDISGILQTSSLSHITLKNKMKNYSFGIKQ